MAAPAVNVGYGGEGFKDDPTPGVGDEPGLEPGLQPGLYRLQCGTMAR